MNQCIDPMTHGVAPQICHLCWRIGCLADMSFFHRWEICHMLDLYPQDIVKNGMKDVWKKAPIAMEISILF